MPVEYRAIAVTDYHEFVDVDRHGFGTATRKPDQPDTWARGEMDRAYAAFEDGRIVGVGRNYSLDVTLPGAALLSAAAVSWISVLPTHRRRGILTGMMGALHDDARERGEPIAILTASESSIYRRFGYGIATWRLGISVERAHVSFQRDSPDDGRVRFLSAEEALRVFPPVYDTARRQRAGMVTRPNFWWPESMHYLADDPATTFHVVHHDRDGTVDGFAMYGLGGEWKHGIATKLLHVIDLITVTTSARDALWRFLLGVDLVHTVAATNLPVDEPLRLMLSDSRRVRTEFVNDGMWVCIIDETAALAARTYAVEGQVALEVHRPDGTSGTFEVEGGPTGAQCRATSASPDIALGTPQLGSVYLGGVSFTELHDAGLVDELRPGAIARADTLFTTHPVPTMTSWF